MTESQEEIEEEFDSESTGSVFGEAESLFSVKQEKSFYKEIDQSSKRELHAVPSGIVTAQHLKDISHELGLIKLCWADVPRVDYEEYSIYNLFL